MHLVADFPMHHYDVDCARIAVQIPAPPGLLPHCDSKRENEWEDHPADER